MTGRASKIKGSAYEREVVSLLDCAGFDNAHKVPLSGAVKTANGRYVADVLFTHQDKEYRGECKRRKDGFKFLYDCLEEADVLFARADHKGTLVTMSYETFMEMTK